MAASTAAVRFIRGSGKAAIGSLQLQLHVKPGASKAREGIIGINDHAVELCVAAQAKEGEANKAVVKVLSDILGIPKTRLHLARGAKSRDKTILLEGVQGDGEEQVTRVVELLERAIA